MAGVGWEPIWRPNAPRASERPRNGPLNEEPHRRKKGQERGRKRYNWPMSSLPESSAFSQRQPARPQCAPQGGLPASPAFAPAAIEADGMDHAARACCAALGLAFGEPLALPPFAESAQAQSAANAAKAAGWRAFSESQGPLLPAAVEPSPLSRVSMGLEIETPWSAHFPELWERFGLSARSVGSLPPEELEELSAACAEREAVLLPRLLQTVACGVPRGNDRYWEFAFAPARDPALLAEIIRLLSRSGLLPRRKPLSLQITLGGVRADEDAQELALLLTALCAPASRLRLGIEQTRTAIHTGWARKGSSGVHEKQAHELSHGALFACEIRPLLLPVSDADASALLRVASELGSALWASQSGEASIGGPGRTEIAAWRSFRERAAALREGLRLPSLPELRWGPGRPIARPAWDRFIEGFGDLAPLLRDALRQTHPGLGALTSLPCSPAKAAVD